MDVFFKKLLSFFKKPLGIVVICLILIGGGYLLIGKKKSEENKSIKVTKGTIVSEVLVTGNVVSSQNANLSFLSSGKIKKIYVKEGDKVKTGDLLIVQDTELLEKELEKAESLLKSAEANYLSLKKGPTLEEINLKEAQVKNAEVNLRSSLENLKNAIKDAYAKVDEAIYTDSDAAFKEISPLPKLAFKVSDFQLQINVENEREVVGNYLRDWQKIIYNLTDENIETSLKRVKDISNYAQKFLNDLSLALNDSLASEGVRDVNIASWRSSVALARSKVSSALNLLSSSQNSWEANKSALEIAKRDLELRKAPPTKEALDSAEASVSQAASQVNLIYTQINQARLRSPINGVIAEIYPKEGEIVSAGQKVISIIGDNSLEIESYVSENDVAKIALGNVVSIKFDAFPGEIFSGKVSFINSAPTIINNIYQYKIKVVFDNIDERFKSGMTANLTIQTARKENALVIPQYAILREKEGAFVFKLVDGKEVKIPVVLGLQDQMGNTEVISGLNEGEEILNIGLK